MTETIKDIGVVLTTILSLIAVLTFIIKPIRNKFLNWIKDTSHVENTDKLLVELKNSFDNFSGDIKNDISELKINSDLNRKANKCICSNRIMNAYEKYKDAESIPSGEVDSLIEHFEIYHDDLGGNGKVEHKFRVLINKPVSSG